MIEQVGIEYPKNGKRGMVIYNDIEKIITVEFDHPKGKEVEKYLTKKQEFKIPESDELDDYRIDNKYPKENQTYFELAMCELYTHTGVWVDWSKETFIK